LCELIVDNKNSGAGPDLIRTGHAILIIFFCRILMVQESLSRELQIEQDKNKSLTERVSSFKIHYNIWLLLVGTHGSKTLLFFRVSL